MISLRKLLFVSAIKQIATQWFQLSSKGPFTGSNSSIKICKVLFHSVLEASTIYSQFADFHIPFHLCVNWRKEWY